MQRDKRWLIPPFVEVNAPDETRRQGAVMLLVAFIFKSTPEKIMEGCYRFAVQAGFDFTEWGDLEATEAGEDFTTVSLIEKHDGLTTLHLEIVIDGDGKHWFVEDAISNTKTTVTETAPVWTQDDIVNHVKFTLGIAKATA